MGGRPRGAEFRAAFGQQLNHRSKPKPAGKEDGDFGVSLYWRPSRPRQEHPRCVCLSQHASAIQQLGIFGRRDDNDLDAVEDGALSHSSCRG